MTAAGNETEGEAEVVEADRLSDLSQQVWEHAAVAESRHLRLVVAVYAASSFASRQVERWRRSAPGEAERALRGIYLLRVNLARFGPEAVVRLTPYALKGAPVFVGWSPVGQVLLPEQFKGLKLAEIGQILIEYFEYVRLERAYRAEPIANRQKAGETTEFPRPQPEGPRAEGPRAEGKASGETHVGHTTTPVAQLSHDLPRYLERARERYRVFARDHALMQVASVDALRQLDRVFDQLGADEARSKAFARSDLAAVAVYFGDAILSERAGRWRVDSLATNPLSALQNQFDAEAGEVTTGERESSKAVCIPTEIVTTALLRVDVSLYGQALAWR